MSTISAHHKSALRKLAREIGSDVERIRLTRASCKGHAWFNHRHLRERTLQFNGLVALLGREEAQ